MRIVFNEGRNRRLDVLNSDAPMGGIPAALWGLSTQLAKRGHEVHVFARSRDRGSRGGVTFHKRSDLAAFADSGSIDVMVALPELLPLLMPVRTRARVVWSHDSHEAGDCGLEVRWRWAPAIGRKGERARLYPMRLFEPYMDRIVVGSRWHADYMCSALGTPPTKLAVVPLGVSLPYFEGPAPARWRHRVVFTSRARRGLDVLLHLFPRIRKVVPEAELHVFGYDYPPEGPAELASSQSEGVYWRGCLTKGELARELRSAALMAYPARHRETFCMAVAEAQAAGQAVVTSRCGALPERVSHGVDGYIIRTERAVRDWDQPDQEDYGRHFVSAVVRLLKDDEIQEQMGREAAAKARKTYDWEAIAGEWERMLQELVRGRDPRPPPLRPGLDLFDPSLLMLSAEGASARVSPSQVEEWLWTAWEAYGFSWESIPGLHTRRVLRAHSP